MGAFVPSVHGQLNLFVNGNFQSGNTGFTSGYVYSSGNLFSAGTYDIVANPLPDHPDGTWVSMGDHTTGTGLMLVVNGGANPNQFIWSETVNVASNTIYALSGWAADVDVGTDTAPPNLVFTINGVQLGTPVLVPGSSSGWQSFTTLWNSQSSTQAVVQISDLTTQYFGNDFALDDLLFAAVSTNSANEFAIYRSVEINWNSQANSVYQIQWTPSLPAVDWFNLGNPVTAVGTNTSVWDRVAFGTRFYRILSYK